MANRLQSSKEQWSVAPGEGGYCVWDWNPDTGQIFLSKGGAQIFGFADDEMESQVGAWNERIHPGDKEQIRTRLLAYLSGQAESFVSDYRVRCKDRNWKWIQTRSIAAIRDSSGRVLRMLGTHTDLTARKQAEHERFELQAILERSLNEIYVFDAETLLFKYVNNCAIRNLGYSLEEMRTKTPLFLKREFTEESFSKKIEPLRLGEREKIVFETAHARADGSQYPVEVHLQLVEFEDGKVFLSVISDITERKKAEYHMFHLANHDGLTGLANRNLLQDRIQQALAQARRNQTRSAVLFIDLDKFKAVNDTLGHDIGDLLLWTVADRLVSAVREEDTVARQGGDEFIVLLQTITDSEDADLVAKKLLTAVIEPYQIDIHELYISASIGIAIFPDDGNDAETLLKNSDIAMYHAKEAGRNNRKFYSQKMTDRAAELHSMETDLRHALERKELILHYQPIINLASDKIVGVEALLRWQHPTRGLISPLRFIPLAEKTGLIIEIGEWVLETACLQSKEWLSQGYVVPKLAINLSTKQFRQKTLVENIAAILEKTGVEPGLIELEITESLLMENVDEAIKTLRALHDLGLDISIDDFGTGFSSLSYLKRFPINTLKIDRSFVMDAASGQSDAAIVLAIITLAHSLQMKVIAEGVETSEQLGFLRSNNCDQFQGFFFSKPLPAAEVTVMLQRSASDQ